MEFPSEGRQRVVIERVTPEIDAGRFPIKRTVGERVAVEADVFCDGHDQIKATLFYRHELDADWSQQKMSFLNNDRWQAEFIVDRQGFYSYTIRGHVDHFETWRRDLIKRIDADQNIQIDLQIGANHVEAIAKESDPETASHLRNWCRRIVSADADTARLLCQDLDFLALVERLSSPAYPTFYSKELQVSVDRERARFSAWYELFPRSAASAPGQHGTFQDVIQRLPYVRQLGFDVLYLPPIHPIGQQFRKGKNNSTAAESNDVGSPWAIGGVEGGHKAILKELGTLEDFDALIAAAKNQQLEIAMDIAFQCSPDHPYVKSHPEWFTARPDGTIQYAENPPKKYQDIYPINFECADWKSLWMELKSIFEFWIGHGVTIFRVDNPHTKAFPFWEWCLHHLKSQHPDLIFLAEAFTRPKLMYRLAKLGFTQSYTYFAWRHSRDDLESYLTELTTTEVAEFFRPNFWPNTPDILTEELQQGGKAAFQRRFILAATLSSNYGIYGPPFEHGWREPVKPGSEEYLNSEKYQIHYHDWNRPDSLAGLISRVNRIRNEYKALQFNAGLKFIPIDNNQLICYSKRVDDHSAVIVVVVNLDSNYTQSGFVELPLQDFGIDEHEPYQMHDLLTDNRYMWYGPRNYVELIPQKMPAHIFRIRRQVRSESGAEYFQ